MGIVPIFPKPRGENGFGGESSRRFSLDDAYLEANKNISDSRINPKSFKTPYSDTKSDLEEVARLEAMFERENDPETRRAYKLATIVEAVVHDQINNNRWFGPNAKSIKSSAHDDYRNGVDSIIEFQEPAPGAFSHLALAIDVTYSNDLERKFGRIKQDIEKGELSEVKYFRSSNGAYEGRLNLVPRVVVALDRQDGEGLAKAWYEKNPALKNDPLRYQMLLEIKQQLQVYIRYAKKLKQDHISEKCHLALRQVEGILSSIPHRSDSEDKYRISRVGQRIDESLSTFI